MTNLTLRVGNTRIIKYSHRGYVAWGGTKVEIVAKIDTDSSLILDIRWMSDSVSDSDSTCVDHLLQLWVGRKYLQGDAESFPELVELLPWEQWKVAH